MMCFGVFCPEILKKTLELPKDIIAVTVDY